MFIRKLLRLVGSPTSFVPFVRRRRRLWWWLTLNSSLKSDSEITLTTFCENIEDLLGFLARQVPIANRKR
jgi:hypothetical protein